MSTAGYMVPVAQLTAWGVPEVTIWDACKRNRERGGAGSWRHESDPSDKRRVLIDYASIPTPTRDKYKLPAVETLVVTKTDQQLRALHAGVRQELRTAAGQAAFDYFHYVARANQQDARELVEAAAWLELLTRCKGKTDVRALRVSGLETKADLLVSVLRLVIADKPRGLRVNNLQVLKRAQSAWAEARAGSVEAALATLVGRATRKAGITKNAQKLSDFAKRLILGLYLNPEQDVKLLPVQVARMYNDIATGSRQAYDRATGELLFGDANGAVALPALSERTITTFLSHPDTMALAARERNGSKFYKDWVRPYVHRSRPQFALSLTSADGAHLGFRMIVDGKLTNQRAVAFVIFDTFSGALVGWSVGDAETRELMRNAYARMLQITGGRVPLENQVDNFARNGETAEIFPTLTACAPYDPQSKYAERYIAQFESDVLRLVPGWLGGNIQDKKAVQKRNPDYAAQGYTLAQITEYMEGWAAEWNNAVVRGGKTRRELLEANVNPACELMPVARQAALFGHDTLVSVKRGAVKLQLYGQQYTYELPDYSNLLGELRNGARVRVRVLPQLAGERVWLYNYDPKNPDDLRRDTFLCEAPHVRQVQAAKGEQTPADKEELSRQLARRAGFERDTNARAQQVPALVITRNSTALVDDPEAVLAQGYTSKPMMQSAAEAVDPDAYASPRRLSQPKASAYTDHDDLGAKLLSDPDED